MPTSSNDTLLTPETLRVQLTELNNRTRWYVAQLWQIPFAYIGITGVTIGTLVDKDKIILGIGSFFLAIAGMIITAYFFLVRSDWKKSITRLQKTERTLGIKEEDIASDKEFDLALMVILIILTIIFLILVGFFSIIKK